jgi:hypothetical protein
MMISGELVLKYGCVYSAPVRAVFVLNLFSAPIIHANLFFYYLYGFRTRIWTVPASYRVLLNFTVEWTDYWHFKLHCFFLRTGMSCLLVMQWLWSLCCWVSELWSRHLAESRIPKHYKFTLEHTIRSPDEISVFFTSKVAIYLFLVFMKDVQATGHFKTLNSTLVLYCWGHFLPSWIRTKISADPDPQHRCPNL